MSVPRTLVRAQEAVLAELGAAFNARNADRVEAATRYLHAVGTPLVEIYEALLAWLVDVGPEWATGPRTDAERETTQFLAGVVARLRDDLAPPSRGRVLMTTLGGARHVIGPAVLVHLFADRGWEATLVRATDWDSLAEQVSAEVAAPTPPALGAACLVVGLPAGWDTEALRTEFQRLRRLAPGVLLVLAGPAAYGDPDLKRRLGVDLVSTHITQVLDKLEHRRSGR